MANRYPPGTKPAKVLPKDVVLTLLGGVWPEAEGFDFELLDEFRSLSPETLQGFHYGEPVGPEIQFNMRVVTLAEEFPGVKA